jgi:hypothetical protein
LPNYDDLAAALADQGAAFGVFPQMSGKRKTQDVEAAKNIPVDILRGRVAGLLGAIPDLLNMAGRSPMPTETFGDTQYEPTKQLPYGSEHYLKTLPLAPTTQTGRVANEMGALVPLDPRTVVKAGKPVVSLLGNELARGMYGNEGSLANVIPTAMKPKQIFIGENAKTWNKDAAQTAVEMEKAGAKPEDIWSSTGTFRGAEGKLRQEISDVPAQLLNKQKDFEGKLHEVLSHEELFKQYPGLQYYDTEIQSQIALPEHLKKTLVGRGKGSFTEKDFVTGEPKIEAQAFSDEDKSTLLHELQHAIQAKESFARGGNVNEFASGPMFNENAKNLTSDLSEAITGGLSAKPSEIIETIKYATQEQIEPILKKYGFNNTQEAIDFLKYEDEKRTPFGQYKRLAGEAEARATQERMGMTAEQRRAKFPYESYDVPINDLIVRK